MEAIIHHMWSETTRKNELVCRMKNLENNWFVTSSVSQLMRFYSHCSRIFPFQQNSKRNSACIKPIYNGKLLEDLEIHPDRYNELNEFPILSFEKWHFFWRASTLKGFFPTLISVFFGRFHVPLFTIQTI